MTLEDLRAFVTACEAKSMSEAARKLGCTQAAVAQHVRRLEHELRVQLFTRLRRGVAPTECGTTLYEAARGALENLELATLDIDRVLKQNERRLRLTTSTGIANRYLREPLLALKARHPDVEIELVSRDTTEARIAAVREGQAELALIPLADPVPGLEVRALNQTPLVLLVHEGHAYAGREQLRAEELATIRYIAQSPTSATYRHVERVLRAAGLSLTPSQIVEDAAAANLLVEMGRGETFVPIGLGKSLERERRIKAVSVPSLPPISVGWAARSFTLLPDVARDFIEVCEQANAATERRRAGVAGAARPSIAAKARRDPARRSTGRTAARSRPDA
jgi:DNA-binding transcriptional LysR family regulator